jgi:hypothetical protein
MKGLYHITRHELNQGNGYRFELRNTLTLAVVLTAFSASRVPPRWLRNRQARLNTIYVLEGVA